ncbi:MAG: guanylate kinase [Pelagibacteraceae bacterium]|nr:guanylate kinase [Pelagibacteraceae bacterium]|tara:strand:- start:438 stop:1055 length:618 start_codon:yes stop_codon:yes gene_type:complete
MVKHKNFLIVLSSPSGAGKTSISREIIKKDNRINLSISVTTRSKRKGEKNKVDYYFIKEKYFKSMIQENKLMEHANVFGNLYGTPKQEVINSFKKNKDLLFDIDWQGYQKLRESEFDVIGIFILPPSKKELVKRLNKRGRDTKQEVLERIKLAESEISHFLEYDYILINENLKESVKKILSIIESERHKRERIINLTKFIDKFRF